MLSVVYRTTGVTFLPRLEYCCPGTSTAWPGAYHTASRGWPTEGCVTLADHVGLDWVDGQMWYLIEDFFEQGLIAKLFIAVGWLAVLIMVASFVGSLLP